jgi:uncharacterized protein
MWIWERKNVPLLIMLAILVWPFSQVSAEYNKADIPPLTSDLMTLTEKAKQGDAEAQFDLGALYGEGKGVAQDYIEAAKWYRKAAEQGHSRAQLNLGILFETGEGLTGDDLEAAKWYRKAASQGLSSAQVMLGRLYQRCLGVPCDIKEALKWYRKAAEQGDYDGQLDYARALYLQAKVNDQSANADAYFWYSIADLRVTTSHPLPYSSGLLVKQRLSVRTIAVVQKRIAAWFRKEADQGFVEGENVLGFLYTQGLGVTQNYFEAVKWYRRAAVRGYAPAQNNLGNLYEHGLGVPRDYSKARDLYHDAANQAYTSAYFNLGNIYAKGYGVAQDYGEAVKWWEKAANQTGAAATDAQQNLGNCYMNGLGVEQDTSEAYFWLSLASKVGEKDAVAERDGITKRLTTAQITAIQERVNEWSPVRSASDAPDTDHTVVYINGKLVSP